MTPDPHSLGSLVLSPSCRALALGRFIVGLPPLVQPRGSGEFPPERLWW